MAVTVPGTPRALAQRPQKTGPGNRLRIGLLGTHRSLLTATPFWDASWLWWANASAWNVIPEGRADLIWDLHPKFAWSETRKNGFKDYGQFLRRVRTPVMMQMAYEDVPASQKFPFDAIKAEYPGLAFHSQTAYQIAYALMLGATEIGLWGIEYGHASEYARQRGNCQLWLGIAIGRGVRVTVAQGCTLLSAPIYGTSGGGRGSAYYGYGLTPEQYEADRKAFLESAKKSVAFSPSGLTEIRTPDDFARAAETRRKDPDWAKEEPALAAEAMDIVEVNQNGQRVTNSRPERSLHADRDGSVSPDHAPGPEASPGRGVNGGRARSRRRDRVLQSPVRAAPKRRHQPKRLRRVRATTSRRVVAGARRAAGPGSPATHAGRKRR